MLLRVLLFLGLLLTPAAAQIAPNYPFTFSPNTTAASGQVNANFNSIRNAVNTNAAHNGANTDITSLGSLASVTASGLVLGSNAVTARLSWSGAVVGGYNIASITRASTGSYNVVFTTPLINTDYQVHLSTQYLTGFTGIGYCGVTPTTGTPPKTVNGFNIFCINVNGSASVDVSPTTLPIDIIVVGGR